MHLSILMENMRREGYEFAVSPPRVLTKTIDGVLCEPVERLVADVPEKMRWELSSKSWDPGKGRWYRWHRWAAA